MRRVFRILSVLWLLASLAVQAQGQSRVLVQGRPPLTEELLERSRRFLEWLVDAPMTESQRAFYEKQLIDSWTRKDEGDMKTTAQFAQLQMGLARAPSNERALLREQIGTQLWSDLRKQAPKDEGARWLLGIYEATHKPIAKGNPPLTRQVADAYLELVCFFSEQSGRPCGDLQKAEPDWEKGLARRYPRLPREEQAELAKAPLYLASVKLVWPTLAEPQKREFLDKFAARQAKGQAEAKAAAATPPAGAKPPAGRKDTAELLEEIRSKHLYFMNMSSMIAGSPYRYY